MRRSRRTLARCAALLAGLALASPADAGLRPRYGGEVAAALPHAAPGFDPAQAVDASDRFLAELLHQPLLRRTADGRLHPILLEAPPESRDGGKTFVLRLRRDLRFHDGRPIRAADLAATLRRLDRSPWGALAAPIRAIDVRSTHELAVRLAVAYPRWPEALAEIGAGVIPEGTATPTTGAGPFRLAARTDGGIRLEAFSDHAAGRPFLDAIALRLHADRRLAARRTAEGGADWGPALAEAPIAATWLLVRAALPAGAEAFFDREEIVRRFVPGAAAPLDRLLPPPHRAPAGGVGTGGAIEGPLELLYDPAVEGHRQVAERIQLRLHDRGVQVHLEPLEGEALLERTRAHRYQLALLRLPLPADPGLAAAGLLRAAGREAEAMRLLARVGEAGPALEQARAATARSLEGMRGVVPLYFEREAIRPTSPRLVGSEPADAWLLPADPAEVPH